MQRMAKGKHAPSVGAVRQNKVLHPSSRKVQKISKKDGLQQEGKYLTNFELSKLSRVKLSI